MSRCSHTERWYARHWHHDRRAGEVSQCVKPSGHVGPHFCERIERVKPEPVALKSVAKAYDVPKLTAEVLKLREHIAGSACTAPMPTTGPELEHEYMRLHTAKSIGGMMLHHEKQRLTTVQACEVAS